MKFINPKILRYLLSLVALINLILGTLGAFFVFIALAMSEGMWVVEEYEIMYIVEVVCIIITILVSALASYHFSKVHGKDSYYNFKTSGLKKVITIISIISSLILVYQLIALMFASNSLSGNYLNSLINYTAVLSLTSIILLVGHSIFLRAVIKADEEEYLRSKVAKDYIEDETENVGEDVIELGKPDINTVQQSKAKAVQVSNVGKSQYNDVKRTNKPYSLSATYYFYWLPLITIFLGFFGTITELSQTGDITLYFSYNYVEPLLYMINLGITILMMKSLIKKTNAYYSENSSYHKHMDKYKLWANNYLFKASVYVVLPLSLFASFNESAIQGSPILASMLLLLDIVIFVHAISIYQFFFVSKKEEQKKGGYRYG